MAAHSQTTNRGASEPLTVDTLRSYPGCEHYTDDEATNIIGTLDALAGIILQVAIRHGTHYDDQTARLRIKKTHDTPLISAS